MDERSAPCKALVLAGGGARGSYQVGVWRALMELDWHPQIITGTSVGSLNGAMFVLDQYETARDMWLAIRSKDVMELPEEDADLSALHQFLRSVVKAGGMDVTPLEEIVERVLDEDALRAAPIRFGLVTVEQRGLKPRELTLDEIPAGKVKDYLMASAACFPALRAREIDGVKFLDGGYSDNMPTGLAKRMGADELVCVDLEGVGTDEQADQNANDQADAVVAGNCLIQRFHIDTPLSYCTPAAHSFLSLTQGRVLL